MNENNNRVSKAYPDKTYQDILLHLNGIEALVKDYKVGLTPEERQMMPKINIDNKAFVDDTKNEMSNPAAADFMPPFLKPTDLDVDITMFSQNETIAARLNNIWQTVDDIRMVAGSEAYTTALTFKKLADAANNSGIPGAAAISAKLGERFAGQGKTNAKGGDTPAA
jgi:hypothetical protein